jgi:hypothetical protein
MFMRERERLRHVGFGGVEERKKGRVLRSFSYFSIIISLFKSLNSS